MVIHIANATVSACGKVYLEGRNDSDDVVRR